MVLSPKNILLLFFVICLPVMQIKPMENHPAVKTYKLVTTVTNAAQETKNFYIKINHKIATASVIGVCLASGVGSGAAAFLLLKSYGAALLYGAISGQCAIAYQLLAKKFDKDFKELKEKIDLLSVHIDDNHASITNLVANGHNEIKNEIHDLKNEFVRERDTLSLALEAIKKDNTNNTNFLQNKLENSIAAASKALSHEFQESHQEIQSSLKILNADIDFIKNEMHEAKLAKDEEKAQEQIAIESEKQYLIQEVVRLSSLFFACDPSKALEMICEHKKIDVKNQTNQQLIYLKDQLHNEISTKQGEGLMALYMLQGKEIESLKTEVSSISNRLGFIEEASKETGDNVKLLVLALNNNTEEKRKKAENQQRILTEQSGLKKPIFSNSYNPHKPTIANPTAWSKQLNYDSKS